MLKPLKQKGELIVKLATVVLNYTKISFSTDKYNPPTSSDEIVSIIPVNEYNSE